MLIDYTRTIQNLVDAFAKFRNIDFNIGFETSGKISKVQFKLLLAETIDSCEKMETYCKEAESYDKANAFIKYRKSLESAMCLLGETKNTENNATYNGKILEQIKQKVADCGQEVCNSAIKLDDIKKENLINDLTDKILLIESEYNAGKISNEKAYRHVLKIKNSFKDINVKNGNKEHDDNLEFLQYAIEESEKIYKTNLSVEVEDKCSSSEFLVDSSDEKVKDLTYDVENLTHSLNQFTDELINEKIESSIDLDYIYNFISAINNSINESRTISEDDINQYAVELNKQIDLLREQQLSSLFKSQNLRELADNVYLSAYKLEEKSKITTQDIVLTENAKRVEKISTQLDELSENASNINVDVAKSLNVLLVRQSNSCLETNPELQAQIDANYEKGKLISHTLIETL